MKSYRELDVWKLSCELVLEIYRLTAKFPTTDQYELTSQMRRAAISIPSNIAEGFSRRSPADNHNFIRIAFGSGAELETQLYLAEQLKFVSADELVVARGLLDRVMMMLNKLGQSLSTVRTSSE
ncbi:MAG: four helix bundle protein [Candidatus Kerfeldbacteria bacterium]|nr:four helix bundle protein [Candidatus Kerfeldbacteria bacterium]